MNNIVHGIGLLTPPVISKNVSFTTLDISACAILIK